MATMTTTDSPNTAVDNALYLSRLNLSVRNRHVQRDLADCYAMHQRILSGFPDVHAGAHAREQFGMLFRVDQERAGPVVLVQSHVMPEWSRLPDGYLAQPDTVKRIDASYDALREGMTLIFRLRANTVKRISNHNMTQGERWPGKRIDLRREEDQLAWLTRKSQEAGFRLVSVRTQSGLDDATDDGRGLPAEVGDVRVAAGSTIHGTQHEASVGKRRLTFGGATFEGRLIVTDVERFKRTVEQGVGPGKAFGFGLLSVAPVPSVAAGSA